MSTATMGAQADWMPRLASVQADLETFLIEAEPLLAARRNAVALLRASDDGALVNASAEDESRAFLETLIDIEELVRRIHRVLNVW
jgi:hypothetical protein